MISLLHLPVCEAIEDIAVLNPTYGIVKLNSKSFIYFLRYVGNNTKLFCTWKDKKANIMNYNTGAVNIDIIISPLYTEGIATFENPESKEILEVELSG
jgi:hypothetical protein